MHDVVSPQAPAHGTERQHPPELVKRWRRILRVVGLGFVLAIGLVVGIGVWGQVQRRAAALETLRQEENFVPVVRTSEVKIVTGPRNLELPGTTQAFDSATVFARATGYITKRLVDIGSRVKAGDVLAIIAAPDLDQQLLQARAQVNQLEAALTQAHATVELARATNERTSKLLLQGWQSKQQGDTDRLNFESASAAMHVAEANLEAQMAVVSRLEELTSFERIVAPFAGTITSRQIDVGSLVNADQSSGTPMFSIDQTDVLRIQVYVPQDSVFGIKNGEEAQVTVPELPGRIFKGKVARNAGSLQAGTRTLLVEVDVDNAEGELYAGLYCAVRFSVPRSKPTIIVPSQAIIFDKNGLSAAVYQDGVAHLRHLDILRDNGAEVEIRAGLEPGDRIVLSPPVGISEGMRVKSNEVDQPAKTAADQPGPKAADQPIRR